MFDVGYAMLSEYSTLVSLLLKAYYMLLAYIGVGTRVWINYKAYCNMFAQY